MSSLGESSHTDGIASDQPMLTFVAGAQSESSYNQRLRAFARKGKCKWASFIAVALLVLLLLVAGAVALVIMSTEKKMATKPAVDEPKPLTNMPKEERKFKFEYSSGEERKEQVIINVKENYTELFAQDVTVYNYFRKRISLHRIEVSPGIKVCLVRVIDKEVKPLRLQNALSEMTSLKVNSTELFVIDSIPVSEEVKNDMTVHQFCNRAKIYSLRLVDETGPVVGLTMEELIGKLPGGDDGTRRYRREVVPNPGDQHNGGPYHCGGPIGTNEKLPAIQYTCTRKKSYCYRNLVNERCEECYHGHYLRTRGCWCPIEAIQTCIRITYKPDKRYCCGMAISPCVFSECGSQRVPYVPIPVITIKITTD